MQLQPVPFSGRPLYAAIFWSACGLWILPEIIASIVKRSPAASEVSDRGSLKVVAVLWWAGIGGGLALSFLMPQTAIHWKRGGTFLAGICMMLAGTAFRWYSAR